MSLLAFIFVTPSMAHAVSNNAGTSGARFLTIGAGARPTAMGDSFVAIADDANAVYYNPAGLGFLQKSEFTALHTEYFQGLNYDFGAYVHPMESGAFALSAATLKTDELTRRGVDESNTGTFTNQDAAYGLSYGRRLSGRVSGGMTVRWIRQSIDSNSAQAWSADVGVLKHFEQRPLSLGLAVRHLGQKIKFNEESDPLPLTVDAGAATDLFQDRLKLSANLRHVRDTGLEFGLGGEWRVTLRDRFRYAVRTGYNSATTDADGASGLSLGAGVGYRLFDIDFAWVPFGDLGNTFRYAAHVKF